MTGPTVVIGYTPSAEGAAALTTGIEEARRRDANVHVINASSGDSYVDAGLAGSGQLDIVRQALEDSGVEHTVEQMVGRSEPADEILDAAARLSAALVVIGLRRRTPVGKLLMGSTAQHVLLRADCPVLAVKA
jgi:nucleotide-binding universal stress UspA family protein